MTYRSRPTHSGFETLRVAGLASRSTNGYHRFGSATNEQLTSRGLAHATRITRPVAIFADFRER